MQMKPLPHPTGPLTQPIGPFQPPQLPPPPQPPPPQFPWSPPPPPQHPPSSQPCPWPWPSSCAHGVPDATGDGGLAFATPAPSPMAVKPSAPAMIASAKIFISFIVQPLYDFAYCNRPSLDFRPLRRPPQRAVLVLVVGSKGLACPRVAARHAITEGRGPTLPSTQGSRLGRAKIGSLSRIFWGSAVLRISVACVAAGVCGLVLSTTGAWIVLAPQHCPNVIWPRRSGVRCCQVCVV
jgi:hypothetical protein